MAEPEAMTEKNNEDSEIDETDVEN
jgi:hypothetical protein